MENQGLRWEKNLVWRKDTVAETRETVSYELELNLERKNTAVKTIEEMRYEMEHIIIQI